MAEKTTLGARFARFREGWGWIFGLVALGLAIYAERLAEDQRILLNGQGAPPLLSWVLFGAAALVFAIGIAPTQPPATQSTTAFFAGLRAMSKRARWLFLGLLTGAMLAFGAAVYLFIRLNSASDVNQGFLINTGSWLVYILMLLLFGAAWVVWERTVPSRDEGRRTTDEGTIRQSSQPSSMARRVASFVLRPSSFVPLGLFVLALLFRLPGLDTAPPGLWFDEAENGLVARGLLAPDAIHPAFIASWTQMGGLYFYGLGVILKIFGDTLIWPLRLLPAFAGAFIAPMLYVIGSRLFGWRVGVAAGVLVAVGAWNVTMSRFGIASLPTVAIDVAAYLCLLQGLRTGRLGWYAGSGVLVGLALQMYYPAQLIAVVLVLVMFQRLIVERMRFFRMVRAGIVAFAVGAIIAFTPVETFIPQHVEDFTQRARETSIFSVIGSEGRPDALQVSIERHAKMFNYLGDANPRHNLPGAPMLDWLTAAFFLSGLGLCVLRLGRWNYFFVTMWFLINMGGGVLSVVFEAPQSHRTLENSVVTALIAAIFLGELWGALDRRLRGDDRRRTTDDHNYELRITNYSNGSGPSSVVRRRWSVVGRLASILLALYVLGTLGWIGVVNQDRYFNKQMSDLSVWMEMNGTNRAIGLVMARHTDGSRLFVSPKRIGIPATEYLAPGKTAEVWTGPYMLPFTQEIPVELVVDPNDEADVYAITRVYPNAKVEKVHGPLSDQPQLFIVTISADDIRSIRGTQTIDSTHGATTVKVEQYGRYSFGWRGENPAPDITVDGTKIAAGTSVPLGLGLHSVSMATKGEAPDFTKLTWSQDGGPMAQMQPQFLYDPSKIEPRGLTALIRKGDVFNGDPALQRVDPQISFYFHLTPLDRPYTIEWMGKLYAPVTGSYAFYVEQLSRANLFIDNKQVLYNPTPNAVVTGFADLTAGLHDIKLEFEDLDGFSHIYLWWTPPATGDKFIIPASFLLPMMGQYPDKPASGAWPTIDQTDDTVYTRANKPAQTVGQSGQPTQPQQPIDNQPRPTPIPTLPGDAISPKTVIGGSGDNGIPTPRTAAVDAQGNVYIYTETDSKIHKFDSKGAPITSWDVRSVDGKPVIEASALLFKDGKLLLLDASASDIITYSLDGKDEGRTHLCQCYYPRGLAPSRDGNLWITDTGFGHVLKVSMSGQTINSFGEVGSQPGQFVEPSSVWESPQGNLFVTDAGNQRVQTFSPDLKPIAQWGMGEGTSRDGNRLTGTADGNALLTEYAARAVIEYDVNGKEFHRWSYGLTGISLIPSWIGPAGGTDEYIVLYPFDNLAAIFILK